MWTKDYSIRLSVFFTRFFLVLLAAGLFLAPQVVGWFIESAGGRPVYTVRICAAFYCCAGPAAVLLLSLDRLLAGISLGGGVHRREHRPAAPLLLVLHDSGGHLSALHRRPVLLPAGGGGRCLHRPYTAGH